MVVWFTKEVTCPMCGSRLCAREVGSGFAVGQDSDLLVRMKSKHIIQAEIHTCQTCRYSGYVRDFAINTSPEQGSQFRREVTPKLVGGPRTSVSATPLPDVEYYWAYQSAAFLSRPPLKLGLLLLRAYWCLRIAPSSRLPAREVHRRTKRYLHGCMANLRKSLRGSRNPHLYYLLGELNRRAGAFDLSTNYFDKFLSKSQTANYLRQASVKLRAAAEEEDARPRTMEELLYDHKTESP